MFIYNAICVMSDQSTSKAGTITSGEDRFMEWKTKDDSYENTQYAQFDTFFEGLFQKDRLLDIIKNFICFSNEGIKSFKILAGYHQYFAVRKAIESTKHATVTDGKGGVFWHTQGSGKSLSMVFYAPQPPGLGQGRRYLIAVHHGEEHFLFRRLQIGQLHRRSQGNLALVHQLQDVGD